MPSVAQGQRVEGKHTTRAGKVGKCLSTCLLGFGESMGELRAKQPVSHLLPQPFPTIPLILLGLPYIKFPRLPMP